jgi:hypothetical protein
MHSLMIIDGDSRNKDQIITKIGDKDVEKKNNKNTGTKCIITWPG